MPSERLTLIAALDEIKRALNAGDEVAEEALIDACKSGAIQTWEEHDGEWIPRPQIKWGYCGIQEGRVIEPGEPGRLKATAVQLDAAAVSYWLKRQAAKIKPETMLDRRSPVKQAAVAAWMKNRIAGWPHSKPFPTEAEDLAAAKNELGDVRRWQIRDKRPTSWRKPGPRN